MGFEYYSIGEHQGNDDAVFNSPQVWLGAVAQATSSIRLNTLVYQLPFQNPLRLAQDTALVDQISRGRLDFGYGTGVWVHEFMRWKLPFEERRAISEEAMEIIKKAWTEEIVTYEGKYWQFEEALPWPQPYQKPHPPIWMAASSPSTFDLVAKMNYNLAQSLDPEDETARKHKIWEEKWKEHGHEGPHAPFQPKQESLHRRERRGSPGGDRAPISSRTVPVLFKRKVAESAERRSGSRVAIRTRTSFRITGSRFLRRWLPALTTGSTAAWPSLEALTPLPGA